MGGGVHESDRRRTDVEAEEEMADAQRSAERVELLADRRGRAGDAVALVAQLLPALVAPEVQARVADLRHDSRAHGRLAHVAGGADHAGIEVEALVEEVVDVRPPFALAGV